MREPILLFPNPRTVGSSPKSLTSSLQGTVSIPALSGVSVGLTISPFLGGITYAKLGYYAVFGMMLGVIAFDFILRLFMIEKKTVIKWLEASKDGLGYGTFSHSTDGSNPPEIVVSGDGHGSLESVPVSSSGHTDDDDLPKPGIRELVPASTTRHRRPRLAKRLVKRLKGRFPTTFALLSSSPLTTALYGTFTQVSLFTSFESILPLFMHRTFGWDSSGTGVLFLAVTIPSLTSPLVGALSDRFGTRKVVVGGFAVSTVTIALLSLVTHNSIHQIVLLSILLAFTGLGTTMMLSPLTADIFDVVGEMSKDNEGLFGPSGAYAQAYGLFDTGIACGTMFGPAFARFVYERAGWKVVTWALATFCASANIPIICFTGSRKNKLRGSEMEGGA